MTLKLAYVYTETRQRLAQRSSPVTTHVLTPGLFNHDVLSAIIAGFGSVSAPTRDSLDVSIAKLRDKGWRIIEGLPLGLKKEEVEKIYEDSGFSIRRNQNIEYYNFVIRNF